MEIYSFADFSRFFLVCKWHRHFRAIITTDMIFHLPYGSYDRSYVLFTVAFTYVDIWYKMQLTHCFLHFIPTIGFRCLWDMWIPSMGDISTLLMNCKVSGITETTLTDQKFSTRSRFISWPILVYHFLYVIYSFLNAHLRSTLLIYIYTRKFIADIVWTGLQLKHRTVVEVLILSLSPIDIYMTFSKVIDCFSPL